MRFIMERSDYTSLSRSISLSGIIRRYLRLFIEILCK